MITNAHTLHGILADLTRTASTDWSLPALNSITLHTEKDSVAPGDANRIYASSTNRFLFGQGWEHCTGSLTTVTVDLDSIRLIQALLNQAGHAVDAELTLVDAGDTLEVDVVGVGHVAVPARDCGLPDVEKLVTGQDAWETSDSAILQANFVSHLAMIGKRRAEPLRFTFGSKLRPSTVDIGEHYRALVMPIRDRGDSEEFRYSFPGNR